MICDTHNWTKKTLPCPWLMCPNGARGLWIMIGKRKKTIYVRRRTKDDWGPRYDWEKTKLAPEDVLQDEEADDLVF